MYLTEKKVFKKKVNKDLYKQLDDYSVNGAYQIMKKANIPLSYKGLSESVDRIAVYYPVKKKKIRTAA